MRMSERSFYRRCVRAFSMSPGKLLSELRFDRGRAMLADPQLPVRTVATLCGFSDSTAFSKGFAKRYGVSPTNYRMTWNTG
jgi:transcriptional regulator GlxA family with amidase domain